MVIRFDELVDQLASEDEDMVIDGAHALGELGDRRAVDVLIELLNSASSINVQHASAIGLRDLGDSSAVPALMDQILNPNNEKTRGTFLYALGGLDARNYAIELVRIIASGGYEAAEMALQAIEGFTGPLALETQRKVLAVLQEDSMNASFEDWRQAMLSQTLKLLKSTNTPCSQHAN